MIGCYQSGTINKQHYNGVPSPSACCTLQLLQVQVRSPFEFNINVLGQTSISDIQSVKFKYSNTTRPQKAIDFPVVALVQKQRTISCEEEEDKRTILTCEIIQRSNLQA
ncbi:hypothetical protein TNCV_1329721 [Trichonephila clavipes]|nr:hypothetical protein TNCV_1329721 [Trichonephila clavipes]